MPKKTSKIGGGPAPKKRPRVAVEPVARKRPRIPHFRGGPLAWRFSAVDKDGPFAWSGLSDHDQYRDVLAQLHQFETMDQASIAAGGSHPVELEQMSAEARRRLMEIEHDDLDELMSFRIGGRRRVWCRMIDNIMSILWWDPEHQVCPSKKRYT